MTKVNYGFDISNNPVGSFQGIGINSIPEGPVEAELIGIIRHEGEDYLIGRTTLAFKDDPNYLGKITVRRATVSIYPDGAGQIFLDIAESDKTRFMEETIQQQGIAGIENKINHRYDSVVEGEEIYAKSINTEIFEKKKMVNDTLDGHLDKVGGKAY